MAFDEYLMCADVRSAEYDAKGEIGDAQDVLGAAGKGGQAVIWVFDALALHLANWVDASVEQTTWLVPLTGYQSLGV